MFTLSTLVLDWRSPYLPPASALYASHGNERCRVQSGGTLRRDLGSSTPSISPPFLLSAIWLDIDLPFLFRVKRTNQNSSCPPLVCWRCRGRSTDSLVSHRIVYFWSRICQPRIPQSLGQSPAVRIPHRRGGQARLTYVCMVSHVRWRGCRACLPLR